MPLYLGLPGVKEYLKGDEVSEVKTEANGSKTKRHKTLVFS